MAIQAPNTLHAAASIVGASGAVAAGAQNITAARTGTGIYTLTLREALAASECLHFVTFRNSSQATFVVDVVHTSDTVKTVAIRGTAIIVSADAPAAAVAYTQADIQAMVDLENEIKTALNAVGAATDADFDIFFFRV